MKGPDAIGFGDWRILCVNNETPWLRAEGHGNVLVVTVLVGPVYETRVLVAEQTTERYYCTTESDACECRARIIYKLWQRADN